MKKVCLIICFICFANILYAQTEEELEAEVDAIIDELILDENSILDYIEELNKYHILYLSAAYNNKTYFLGRDLNIDQFTVSPQVIYQHHSGFYLGISGVVYSEFDPKWDLTTASLGFSKNFGKHDNFNFDVGYSRYIFTESESRDFENSLEASFSLETKNSLIGASAGVTYFFGDEQGVQNNFDIYSNLDLFKISKKHQVSFNPQVSFILGNESIDTSRLTDFQLSLPIVNLIINEFDTYALRNTQLSLPLNLEINDFELEFGYNFNFPNALIIERNLDNSSYFNIGVSYIFSFD
ncbi:MAG: hypothetical protein HKN90_03895 [Flavobacteriaceae bacterium]|nr:hypothetical protein [Flavobacteriaceae bacterium]